MTKEQELAYFAGFLDGEGCFCVTSSVTVKCAHTHYATLERLSEIWGGNIAEHNSPTHKKQAWVWSVHADRAVQILKDLIPYLHEKKHRASLLIEYQSTIGVRGKRVSDDVKSRREEIKKELGYD